MKIQLFPELEKTENEEEAVVETGTVGYVMDILNLREMLCWSGLDIGEENSYLFQKNLCDLARKNPEASNIRLFGKIMCSVKDYWIAEVERATID